MKKAHESLIRKTVNDARMHFTPFLPSGGKINLSYESLNSKEFLTIYKRQNEKRHRKKKQTNCGSTESVIFLTKKTFFLFIFSKLTFCLRRVFFDQMLVLRVKKGFGQKTRHCATERKPGMINQAAKKLVNNFLKK